MANASEAISVQAARNAAKTHCARGHLLDEANTYLAGPYKRWRVCRICARERLGPVG